jgi:hypothetical protein
VGQLFEDYEFTDLWESTAQNFAGAGNASNDVTGEGSAI